MTSPGLPSRSPRFGVGKQMGSRVYVHRDYEHVLPADELKRARNSLPMQFEYDIVKFDYKRRTFSFIQSPDFDTAPEPEVGAAIIWKPGGTVRRRNPAIDPEIYHHKWLMVTDDYLGFHVAAAKSRSLAWLSLGNVDMSRVGRRSYWMREVVPRLKDAR